MPTDYDVEPEDDVEYDDHDDEVEVSPIVAIDSFLDLLQKSQNYINSVKDDPACGEHIKVLRNIQDRFVTMIDHIANQAFVVMRPGDQEQN